MKTAEELFKTYGEARKYCEDNGFEINGSSNPWTLADKIIKICANQDKITRHACAESSNEVVKFFGMTVDEYQSRVHSAIMNTKAI